MVHADDDHLLDPHVIRDLQDGAALEWSFEEHVSAAGWVDDDTLLIASETGLGLFDIATGRQQRLAALEAETSVTRSNDGRADPWGGFWIGTMGKAAEPGAGAIYRYFRGEIRRVFDRITIPNAICFSPDGDWLYFTDTPRRTIWRQRLRDADGWPAPEAPESFVDLTGAGLNPDGAVVDRDGRLWNAQWGPPGSPAMDPTAGSNRRFPSRPARSPARPSAGRI